MRKRYPQVKDLHSDALYAGSVNIDWRERLGEDSDGWTSYEANECDKCGAIVVLTVGQGDEKHADCVDAGESARDTDCDGWIGLAEGPMMNYFYPLPSCDDDRHSASEAELLADLPLCLVEFKDDGWALALTGGGMDLSWEICEAFMRLGYLPPLKYCADLPDMAGDTYQRRAYVLRGAQRSLQIAGLWAKSGAARVKDLRRRLKAREKAVTA